MSGEFNVVNVIDAEVTATLLPKLEEPSTDRTAEFDELELLVFIELEDIVEEELVEPLDVLVKVELSVRVVVFWEIDELVVVVLEALELVEIVVLELAEFVEDVEVDAEFTVVELVEFVMVELMEFVVMELMEVEVLELRELVVDAKLVELLVEVEEDVTIGATKIVDCIVIDEFNVAPDPKVKNTARLERPGRMVALKSVIVMQALPVAPELQVALVLDATVAADVSSNATVIFPESPRLNRAIGHVIVIPTTLHTPSLTLAVES